MLYMKKMIQGTMIIKRQLCKNAGITLIEVWGNDWTEFNKETKNEIKDFFSAKRLKKYKHISIYNPEKF